MPTQRFLKLKEEKKQAILEAAVHEFSRVPYSSASINQIIKEADISRGRFYTYFEDKDDLMQYMLRGFRESCQAKVFRTLKESGGNPFAAAVQLLEAVMEQGEDGLGYRMYRNMLSDLSLVNQNHLFGISGFMLEDEAYRTFIKNIYERIDRDHYPIDEENLAYLVEMLMLITIKAVTQYYKNVVDKEQLLTVTRKEMQILEKGICNITTLQHGQRGESR